MDRDQTLSIRAFLWYAAVTPVTVTESQIKRVLNVEKLKEFRPQVHSRVWDSLNKLRAQHHAYALCVTTGWSPDQTLMPIENYHCTGVDCGELMVLSDYFHEVEDLPNKEPIKIHASRLELFRDIEIVEIVIMYYVL